MTATDLTELRYDVADGVATVTLHRPERLNAFTLTMADELARVAAAADADDDVRVVVVTGAGRAFCAGADLGGGPGTFGDRRTRARPPGPLSQDIGGFPRDAGGVAALPFAALRKPVIAAVNGYALGGGLETALTCDIRIASTTATFAAPEIKLGWIGGGGMSALLAHSVGASNAALMTMTGDTIDARRALAWGLVSELLEPAQLLPRALELAATIASRPPIAAETAKANLAAAFNLPLAQAIAYERELQGITFATEDAAEGRRAFAEKRPGIFRRR